MNRDAGRSWGMTLRILSAAVLAAGLILAVAATALPVTPEPASRATAGKGPYCPRGHEDGYRARKLVGKPVPRARKAARRHDCSLRIVQRNGRDLAVTADFVPSRINVAVRDGRVTGIAGVS